MADRQYQTNYQLLQPAPQHDEYPLMEPSVGMSGSGRLSSSQESRASRGSPGLLLHTISDRTRQWHHIEDLDSFFKMVYRFHQQSGYNVILLREVAEIVQFIFIVGLTVFCGCSIDYAKLLGSEFVHFTAGNNATAEIIKVSISECVFSYEESIARMSWQVMIVLIAAAVFLVSRLGYAVHNAYHFWATKQFFLNALKIDDASLQDVTWDEVKKQLMEVQLQQRMCVHKDILTSLDIYQRILRVQNYMVALVNQNVIPVHFDIPFVGDIVYITKGYEFNLNVLLFWGSSSLLEKLNIGRLRDEQTKKEVVRELENKIAFLAVANLVLMPFIFVYQLLYALFRNLERVKNEPGSLAGRCWSHYARLYLRHYNELDHELAARLNRAYRPATTYLGSFSSPTMAIVATSVQFMASAVFGIAVIISFVDDDFLRVDHVINFLTAIFLIITVAKTFIPDENLVWVPELLMERIVAQIHYLPEPWTGKLHTNQVRKEFACLFQYKFVHILEELLSPVITPFILFFSLRYRAKQIVDFFNNFTVEVEGIGHVCSFAQMNIHKHGSPSWQPQATNKPPPQAPDGGRTELSLVHFAFTNPDWQPPKAGAAFLKAIKHRANGQPLAAVPEDHLQIDRSINSLNYTAGDPTNQWMQQGVPNTNPIMSSNYTVRGHNGSVTHMDGPLQASITTTSMHSSVIGDSMQQSAMVRSGTNGYSGLPSLENQTNFNPLIQPQSAAVYGMGMSCLYLRGLNNQRRNVGGSTHVATQHTHGNYDEHADDDSSPELAAFQSNSGGLSYSEGRLYQRTPSPPPADPFADGSMMSNIGSVQNDAISANYQDLLSRASDMISHQNDDSELGEQSNTQATDNSPLMHEFR